MQWELLALRQIGKKVFSARRGLAALLAVSGALLLVAGCLHAPSAPSAPAGPAPAQIGVQATFVGNAACAECHGTEAGSHSRSRHAHTLRLVSRSGLEHLAPPTGNIPHTGFVVSEKEDKYAMGFPRQSDAVAPMEYALGSGKTGMTYVSVVENARLVEFRMSWFPAQHTWYVTPGAEKLGEDDLGRLHSSANARKCILCHAVTLPADTPVPAPRFFGVGCESCHGPGSAHIAAIRAGKPSDGPMEKMERWPASRLNTLCGKCHGTEQDVQSQPQSAGMTNRLQAYGLMQSPCYKQSKDTLSCVTCHDPHTDAKSGVKSYEAVCLTCHSSAAPVNPPPRVQRTPGNICPVNPTVGCIGCHMPARPAIADSALPTMMADHFIRARP